MRIRWLLAVLCLAAVSLGWGAWERARPAPGLPELAAALGERRLIEPRLTGGFAYAPCERVEEQERFIPRARCSALPEAGTSEYRIFKKIFSEISAGINRQGTVKDLQVEAVSQLLWLQDQGSVGSAVTTLEAAAELAPGDAQILNDLAAAYFVRAQQNDEPYDLILALSTIDKAVAADGGLLEARFNRALILQEMFLPAAAWFAWQAYLDLDEESAWAEEAKARLRSVKPLPVTDIWKRERELLNKAALRGNRAAVQDIVSRFRQPARKYAEEDLLPDWGEAMGTGNLRQAGRSLAIARAIGSVLLDTGGDAMIHDAVAVIDQVPAGSKRLRDLIEGHRAYGHGYWSLQTTGNRRIDQALPQLKKAARALHAAGTPFFHWARLQLASCDYFHENFEESRRVLEEINRLLPGGRYPSLRGRAHYIIGSIEGLRGKPGDSLRSYEKARYFFRKAGEVENLATIDQHVAITLGALGSEKESCRHLFRSFRRLDEIQTYRRVFAILDGAGVASLRQGYPEVALHFQDALLAHARRWKDAEQIAAALQRRADTLSAAGFHERALRELERASQEANKIADPNIRSRMRAHIAVIQGQIHVSSRPQTAVLKLTEAIHYFDECSYRFYISLAFFLRARAHLVIGDSTSAAEDFRSGLREIESSRENLNDERLRILLADQATRLLDEILSSEANREDGAASAFDLAEQTRAQELLEDIAAASISGRSRAVYQKLPQLTIPQLQRALPKQTLVLKYAVLPDHVLLWSLTAEELRLHIIPISSLVLERQVYEASKALQSKGRGRQQRARVLEELYLLLIAPEAEALKTAEDLVVIPDKSLHLLPFSALVEPRTGRYLVQDHALAVAPSVNVFVRCLMRSRRIGHPKTALVVGDPSFDRRKLRSLARLPGARAEALQIARLYPLHFLLTGGKATRRNVLRRIADGPEVIQISAHSVLSLEHPEYSRLILAPDQVDGDSGFFYLYEIRELDLRHTRLVVLAGCDTAAGRVSISEGSLSLARSFLAAGAPAVLASLWEIDDAESRELLTDFHRRLRSGEDPVKALRLSQLAVLQAGGASLSKWASFQLIGSGNPNK